MTISDDLDRLKQLASERHKQAQALEAPVRQLAEMSGAAAEFWKSLQVDLEKGNIVGLGLSLRKKTAVVRRLGELSANVARLANQASSSAAADAAALEELANHAMGEAKVAALRFHRDFPPSAEEAGLQVDATSRYPLYTFHDGFIELRASPDSLEAEITVRDGDEPEVLGLDVDQVIQRLKGEEERLFKRSPDPKLIDRLQTAYRGVLREEGLKDGDTVSLRRVMNRLAKNSGKKTKFRNDEFNIDLARLMSAGDVNANGHSMQVYHTRNKRQGMLLHGMEQGGYLGLISFTEDAKEGTPG